MKTIPVYFPVIGIGRGKIGMLIQLIPMKKSRKKPCDGDIFVLQPFPRRFYYGKVIQTDLQSTDSFIRGMLLIYIYNYNTTEKKIVDHLEEKDLLIAPMVVNKQPWMKGFFETIGNVEVTETEKNVDFGFWDVLRDCYVDTAGRRLEAPPRYCSTYGLGSYGAVAKEVLHAIL